MRRMQSLRVCAKFSPNGLARSIRILKHLGGYANVSPNGLAHSMRRMKGLRVHAKLSPSARYGFESWRTLCSKFTRSDSTQFSKSNHGGFELGCGPRASPGLQFNEH